jgi:uncharacterized protein YjiS (DUF1127 family)
MKQTICTEYGTIEAGHSPVETLKRLATAAQQQLRTWKQRSETRTALARLSDYQLRDIGISDVERQFEAKKPFWEA